MRHLTGRAAAAPSTLHPNENRLQAEKKASEKHLLKKEVGATLRGNSEEEILF
jgi:hypothetical protein